MKIFSSLRMLALLALGLMAVAIRVEAQTVGLSIVASPSPVAVSNSLTYTITVTNLTLITENFIITNTLPASAQFQSASNPYGSFSNNGNTVIFSVTGLPYGNVVQMTVTALPTTAALITDSVFVISGDLLYSASTSVGTQVTNAVVQQADLALGMTGPAALVFSNDWMVYGVNVTNLGPDTASGIFLTNTLPPGVGFKSVSPAFTRLGSGSNVIFNLGTLTNQAFINFQLTVQPTNAGTWTFVSVVSTNNSVPDTNAANNSTSINIVVSNFFSGQLFAYTNSAQVPNGQVGYLEQTIVVSNTGPTPVAAARVIVSGLTNRLANAVGTNNGNPFVVYSAALDTNQSVSLLLQFYPNRTPFAFGNAQLHPVEVTPLDLTPPANLSSNVNFTGIFQMPSGGMLLEFPTVTNRTYTVEYSSNLLSTNWLAAQPSIVAPANYTFWIDYGPPATLSHPNNSAVRFYRVFLNP